MRCCICNEPLVTQDSQDRILHHCPYFCHLITEYKDNKTKTEEFPITIELEPGYSLRLWVENKSETFRNCGIARTETSSTVYVDLDWHSEEENGLWELHRYQHVIAPGSVKLPAQ